MSAARAGVGTHKLTVQIEQGAVVVVDDKTCTVEDSDSDTCGKLQTVKDNMRCTFALFGFG